MEAKANFSDLIDQGSYDELADVIRSGFSIDGDNVLKLFHHFSETIRSGNVHSIDALLQCYPANPPTTCFSADQSSKLIDALFDQVRQPSFQPSDRTKIKCALHAICIVEPTVRSHFRSKALTLCAELIAVPTALGVTSNPGIGTYASTVIGSNGGRRTHNYKKKKNGGTGSAAATGLAAPGPMAGPQEQKLVLTDEAITELFVGFPHILDIIACMLEGIPPNDENVSQLVATEELKMFVQAFLQLSVKPGYADEFSSFVSLYFQPLKKSVVQLSQVTQGDIGFRVITHFLESPPSTKANSKLVLLHLDLMNAIFADSESRKWEGGNIGSVLARFLLSVCDPIHFGLLTRVAQMLCNCDIVRFLRQLVGEKHFHALFNALTAGARSCFSNTTRIKCFDAMNVFAQIHERFRRSEQFRNVAATLGNLILKDAADTRMKLVGSARGGGKNAVICFDKMAWDFKDISDSGTYASVRKALLICEGMKQSQWPEFAVKKSLSIKELEELRYDSNVKNEIELLMAIRHPLICACFGCFEKQLRSESCPSVYAAMELCGQDLRSVLQAKGSVSIQTTRIICSKLLESLSFLHWHGLVHLDVKPENILLRKWDGNIILIDFGSARRIGTDSSLAGTLMYCDPSLFGPNDEPLDHGTVNSSCDLYSLGVVLYELLHGRTPFVGNDQKSLIRKIRQLPVICDRSLDKNAVSLIEGLTKKVQSDRLGYATENQEDCYHNPSQSDLNQISSKLRKAMIDVFESSELAEASKVRAFTDSPIEDQQANQFEVARCRAETEARTKCAQYVVEYRKIQQQQKKSWSLHEAVRNHSFFHEDGSPWNWDLCLLPPSEFCLSDPLHLGGDQGLVTASQVPLEYKQRRQSMAYSAALIRTFSINHDLEPIPW